MKKSKVLERLVRDRPELESYHVEECDGKTHHWISASDDYIFRETETTTINGFTVRELLPLLRTVMPLNNFRR